MVSLFLGATINNMSRPLKFNKDTIEEILKLYNSFIDISIICEKFKISSGHIHYLCRKYNTNCRTKTMYPIENYKNKKFGRLKIIDEATNSGPVQWNCLCDCGTTKTIKRNHILQGEVKSCGCLGIESRRIEYGLSAMKRVFGTYKTKARYRELPFELSFEDFKFLTSQNCFYCERKPSNLSETRNGCFVYNGIDRIDSSNGYFLENCVPCCFSCNKAKNDLSIDDFLSLVKKICQNEIKIRTLLKCNNFS